MSVEISTVGSVSKSKHLKLVEGWLNKKSESVEDYIHVSIIYSYSLLHLIIHREKYMATISLHDITDAEQVEQTLEDEFTKFLNHKPKRIMMWVD